MPTGSDTVQGPSMSPIVVAALLVLETAPPADVALVASPVTPLPVTLSVPVPLPPELVAVSAEARVVVALVADVSEASEPVLLAVTSDVVFPGACPVLPGVATDPVVEAPVVGASGVVVPSPLASFADSPQPNAATTATPVAANQPLQDVWSMNIVPAFDSC